MKSNKTETCDGDSISSQDSSGTSSSYDSERESQKRSLSDPTDEVGLMKHKKFRPLNKQLCRESTDEDDIKVLKSDYTRSLDDEKNRKDSDQSEESTEQSVQPDRETDLTGQIYLSVELKLLKKQNVEKEKQIVSLSNDLSVASKEIA